MKKLIIMASGIVLKEYCLINLTYALEQIPKVLPEIPAEIYSKCRFSQARAKNTQSM